MKIGILTQPLLKNYGGILQAYALQLTLKRLGHEAWLVQRSQNSHSFYKWLRTHLTNSIKYVLGRKRVKWYSRKQENATYADMQHFIDRNIMPRTPKIFSSDGLYEDYKHQHYDAYVVGSDQVWRPVYSPCQSDYYLGFLPTDESVIRLAYAASFGTERWEYSDKLSHQCKVLLQNFKGVSVREDSGIDLCKGHLERNDVLQVLDPTLLLDKDDYEHLVGTIGIAPKNKKIFCYVLDDGPQLNALRLGLAKQLHCECFTISSPEEKKCPSPSIWLRAFMEADYILTDSFHGCVFSIIFNRPFVVLGNEGRGQSRFNSLLKLFGLQNQLAEKCDVETIYTKMMQAIDWKTINSIREVWKRKSLKFLQNYLEDERKS